MVSSFSTAIVTFFFLVMLVSSAEGEVYKVGNGAGWTILNHVNYSAWASKNKFHVGDTVVFTYDPQFHNVMQVSRADYRSCSAVSPIKTYTTGNDSIRLERKGHYFFICGFPGHCSAGQFVDIRIPKTSSHAASTAPPLPSSASSSPSTSPPSSSSGSSNAVPGPAPHPNTAPISHKGLLGLALAVITLSAASLHL